MINVVVDWKKDADEPCVQQGGRSTVCCIGTVTKEGSSDSDSKQTCSGECMTNYDAKSKCKSTVSTTNDCTKKLSNRHVDGVCCEKDADEPDKNPKMYSKRWYMR